MLKILSRYSSLLTLLSVVLAVVFALIFPQMFAPIEVVGDVFIKLLKLFALPLVATALVVTLGDMGGSAAKMKSVVRGVSTYVLVSELLAVSIALILFNIFKVGTGVNPDILALLPATQSGADQEVALSVSSFLSSAFTSNIFESLMKYDLLPVALFSILFGIGCHNLGNGAKPLIALCISIRDVSMTCLNGVMLLAPFGIFSLVGSGVAQAHTRGSLGASLKALLSFLMVLLLGLLLHALWQVVLAAFLTRQSPLKMLRESVPVFTTAFATSSSMATLPTAMKVADSLKGSPHTVRFMLPLCASINLGGMMMYEVSAGLFFSQMLGYHLNFTQQVTLAFASICGGMAIGGIPETSLVSMVMVFKMVHVPVSAISLLLPMDRVVDRFRTMVNIFGNMCGTISVSALDKDRPL